MSEQRPTVTPYDAARVAGPRIRPVNYEPRPGDAVTTPRICDCAGCAAVAVCEDIALDPRLYGAAHRLFALVMQVLDGHRAAAQLAPLMATTEVGYLCSIVAGVRPRTSSQVLRVRVTQPSATAGEVAAVIRVNGRPRAVAARFERDGQAWRCTLLRVLSARGAAAGAGRATPGTARQGKGVPGTGG